ncbi:MAG: hypothetical protein WAV05_00605 [Anaerolineales bacterium]
MILIRHLPKKTWLIIPVIIVLLISAFVVLEVRAQEELVNELTTRLDQLGVPVKSITIDDRIPFKITITILSIADNTDNDMWNKHMAKREASLAHKFGLNLESFILIMVSPQGDILDWSQIFLNQQYSYAYRQFSSGNKNLDNITTKSILNQQLNFKGMTVDELQVTTGAGSEQDVQTVLIRLSASNIQTANQAIPGLIGSLKAELNKVNQESDYSMIAICRLWILDTNGDVLLDYLYDLEMGSETWGLAPGITDSWFPHPLETIAPTFEPTVTPPGYPPPYAGSTPIEPYPPYP